MGRRSRNRSSSAGSEKIERVGDRQGKMERYWSTGQSPQWAVAPREEEEEKKKKEEEEVSLPNIRYLPHLQTNSVQKI